MTRVFVIEPVREEYLAGLPAFGEVITVFNNQGRPPLFSDDYGPALIALLRKLDYDPSSDYIAVAGKQVPLFIASAEISATFGPFQVLMFHAGTREYLSRTIGDANGRTLSSDLQVNSSVV